MAIEPGTKLGAFEITGLLGKGGMGEVYRARDTKLGREVAIKVLSDQFAKDADMLARFEREALSLARLDHPNVGGLYDFQHHEGVHFLVMQLIEGESLADRLARGPLPIDEVARIFTQIAEGLEAAHERGIIHRDLKPANIKVAADDRVKILDFGIAKTTDAQSAAAVPTPSGQIDPSAPTRPMSHTPSAHLTGEGMFIGTPHYMSPEQARGKPVDRRADIWAYGVCLYQALTGKIPFDGETFTDVVTAVLRDTPDLDALPAGTPPHIIRLLERCLAKNLRERLRDIGEAWYLLTHPEREPPQRNTLSTRQPSVRFAFSLHPGQRLSTRGVPLAFSRNGDLIVMVVHTEGSRMLYARMLDELEYRPLAGTDRAYGPFISPDSEWIGFFSGRTMKKTPAAGGTPQTVTQLSDRPLRGVWTHENEIVWSELNSGLMRVDANGGNKRTITEPDRDRGESMHVPIDVTDTEGWITMGVQRTSLGDAKIEAVSLATGERSALVDPAVSGSILPSGHLVHSSGDKVFATRVSGVPPKVSGPTLQVLDNLILDAENYLAQHTVSPSGSIVYAPNIFDRLKQPLYWVTRDGQRNQIPSGANYFAGPRISPDGDLIATVCSDPSGHLQVCIHDIRRSVLEWITRDSSDAVVPVWHPSSDRFVLTRSIANNGMFSYGLDGDGFTRIHENETPEWPSSYSPDGRFLLHVRAPRAAVMEIWVLNEDGAAEPLVTSQAANFCPRFDPTGEYFAYVSNESGRWEIYLKPFKKPGRRIQISIDGGTDPVWAPDGSELFYRNGDTVMAVPIEHKKRIVVGQPKPLFDFPFGSKVSVYTPNFDIHPDGDRFVMTETTADARGATELVVVTNFCEELNRLLPPDQI